MAFAPVALGTPEQSASGSGITGLAYGAPPTAGNLLVCWWVGQGVSTAPATPTGWSVGQFKTTAAANMAVVPYYKIAAGGDAVPTFASITGSVQTAMLGEFSGNVATSPKDQVGSNASSSATTPMTVTLGAADGTFGDLVVYVGGILHSSAVVDSASATVNSAAGNDTNNNSTSTVDHFNFGYGITTSNATADSIALSHSTTSLTATAVSAISFHVLFVQRHAIASLGATASLTATARVKRGAHATLASKVALTATGRSQPVPALVGSLGTPVTGAAGAAITGLAYGQTPTAGNLLVLWWVVQGATTTPGTPTGWTGLTGSSANSLQQVKVWIKKATGGDAVPSIALIAGGTQTAMLGEFSGAQAAVDQIAAKVALTSPNTATASVVDQRAGELVVYVGATVHSGAVTESQSVTVNGVAGHDTNNNGTSTVDHFNFGWSVAASNASPDVTAYTFSTTSLSSAEVIAYSIRLAGFPQTATAKLSGALGLSGTATSIVVGAKGSPATLATTLGVSASASVIGAGPGSVGQATLPATMALHATGSVFHPTLLGQVTLPATLGLTSHGKVLHRAHIGLSATLGLAARGVARRQGHATLAGSLTLAAKSHVARHGQATLASTLSLAATGLSAAPAHGTAVLHTTLAFHASGRLHHIDHATLASTLALSAKAHVTRGAHATLATHLGLTAQGKRRTGAISPLAAHLALQARARVAHVDAFALSAVLGLRASASVGTLVLLGRISLADDTLALIALTDED